MRGSAWQRRQWPLPRCAVAGAASWDTNKDGLRPIPALTSHVTDLTNTLSAGERQALDAKLSDWEARTTNQLAVLVVPTTAPETIDDYGIRVADAWKIGQKGDDNGAIFIVAKDDKRMRIEVGYGFEGVLTDVTSRRIIGETVAPLFSQGKFAAGIDAGVDRIIAVVDDGKPLPPPGKTARKPPRSGNIDFGTLFIVLLVAVPLVGGVLRSILGNLGGSLVGGGIAGAAAWFIAGSLLIAGHCRRRRVPDHPVFGPRRARRVGRHGWWRGLWRRRLWRWRRRWRGIFGRRRRLRRRRRVGWVELGTAA